MTITILGCGGGKALTERDATDSRSGIASDPNRVGSDDDQQYIARLGGRVTQVSVETVRLVSEMAVQVDLLAAVGVAAAVGG